MNDRLRLAVRRVRETRDAYDTEKLTHHSFESLYFERALEALLTVLDEDVIDAPTLEQREQALRWQAEATMHGFRNAVDIADGRGTRFVNPTVVFAGHAARKARALLRLSNGDESTPGVE